MSEETRKPTPDGTEGEGVHGAPFPRSDGYMQLLSFVVSNAHRGEIMAVENYSEMVHLMPDVDSKIATVNQAREESKHVLLLEKLASYIGFSIDESMVEAEWTNVRQHFHDSVRSGNLAACLIIQDLMVESLAIGLYRVFASASNGDGETQRIAENMLKDELDHLDIGVHRIQGLLQADSEAVHDSLVWAHHRVMPCLFEMVHNACDFLCKNKDLDCDIVDKGSVAIDLEMLKVAALENYVDMLDKATFDVKVVNQLVASMASYEVPGRTNLGLDKLKERAARPS